MIEQNSKRDTMPITRHLDRQTMDLLRGKPERDFGCAAQHSYYAYDTRTLPVNVTGELGTAPLNIL